MSDSTLFNELVDRQILDLKAMREFWADQHGTDALRIVSNIMQLEADMIEATEF